jgi:uroporphyrinogen-III decarboxylase
MTDAQWETLKKIIRGESISPLPVGFIIDSPWLPNWCGIRILDYFSSDDLWLKANLKAINDFPDVLFLPGFWSEYGMCTEPSAFGARCTFPENEFPHAHKILQSAADIESLIVPNPGKDGLLPFVLNRLKLTRPQIEASGHRIRFAVARGPLNIASYLMGSAEFLTTMMMQPDMADALLKKITAFLKDWLRLQMEMFPTIDGILLLDDIIGFIGETEFLTFGLPRFKELYDFPVSVKFLHNDAPCRVSAPHLPEMGVNLYNMGFDIPLNELKQLTGNKVALIGNIPPRDVLANGNETEVSRAAEKLRDSLQDKSQIIFSCGGGMPPGVSTRNVTAFINAVRSGSGA